MLRALKSTSVQAAWLHSLMAQGSFVHMYATPHWCPKVPVRHSSAHRISSQLQEAGKVSTPPAACSEQSHSAHKAHVA